MTTGIRWTLLVAAFMAVSAQAATSDRATSTTYNAQGLIDTVDGPRTDVSDVTHYAYDSAGRLASVTDPLGHVSAYDTYDMYGHPGRVTDANGVVTVLTYTPEGWLASTTRDSTGTASVSSFTYDAVGNVIQSKDGDGVTTTYTYDPARRLTDITDGVGNRIHYTLDAAGNRVKEETFDASGTLTRSVARTYNSLSQLMTIVDGLGHTVLTFDSTDGYDTEGHPVHSADAIGTQRKQGYDALQRLVSSIENYNGSDTATKDAQSVTAYDAIDNVEGFSDPDSLATTYRHNGLGDLLGVTSPDTGTTSYTYDAAGNRLTRTDAKGVTTTFAYDALNRTTSTSYADAALNVTYGYDEPNAVTGCAASAPVGHLTSVSERAVVTTYCYDPRGNLSQKRQAIGSQTDVTSYTYTPGDRVATVIRPSGSVVTYTRDTLGRVIQMQVMTSGGAMQSVVSAINYLPFGPVSSYTLGNGQTVTRTYDANYAVTDIVSPVLSLHFSRDALGRITALTQPGGNPVLERYDYDPLYRLTSVADPSDTAIEAYTYSKTGDRLSKVAPGLATGTYGYQAGTHWLTSIGTASRAYDANGNTTASAAAGEALGYGYDGRDRLTVIQRSGATVGTYVYNAMGQRVAKTATFPASNSERFAYGPGGQLVGEYGTSNRDYLWLGDVPVAVLTTVGGTTTATYVHADAMGTPRVVTDTSGATVWSWAFQSNPFGEQAPVSTSGYTLNLRFPGQYFDAESGLVYNANRFYDPTTGRYIQSDPLGVGAGPNTYGYVGAHPLDSVDPQGLEDEDKDDISEWEREQMRAIFSPRQGPNLVASSRQAAQYQAEILGEQCPSTPGTSIPEVDTTSQFQRDELTQFTKRYLSGSGGRWGSNAVRQQNVAVRQSFQEMGLDPVAGAGAGSEERIPGPDGGVKGSRYVDITMQYNSPDPLSNPTVVRIQTVTTLRDGITPTKGEASAASRIQEVFPNDVLILIPKGAK